jgi:hypothetical protein
MAPKPKNALESLNDAARQAVHKAATNPLAPPRVREAMKQLERDLKKKQ